MYNFKKIIKAGSVTIATTNEITKWISSLHSYRSDILSARDYIVSLNHISDCIVKEQSSQVNLISV